MQNAQPNAVNPWADAPIIHAYSRAQALADGVLINLSEWAREAGFTIPVAVTRGVWELLEPPAGMLEEDVAARGWDMLVALREAVARVSGVDQVRFAPVFAIERDAAPRPVALWAKCGPGDLGEPVLTVMLEGED